MSPAPEEALAEEEAGGLMMAEIIPNNDPDGAMLRGVVDSIVSGLNERIVASG